MNTLELTENKWWTQRNLENEYARIFIREATLAFSITEEEYEQWTDAQKKQWELEHPPLDIDEYANSEPEE